MIKRWTLLGLFLGAMTPVYGITISTATGDTIRFDTVDQKADIEGHAVVQTATGTLKADRIWLDVKNKTGEAEGNIVIEQPNSKITGTWARYDWNTSTGVVSNAAGVSPPWTFHAQKLVQRRPDLFDLTRGELTSCDAIPPHYWIHSNHATMVPRDRMTFHNPVMDLGGTSVFWLPYFTKSLKPKKYTLSVEPGYTSRDGLTVKTVFGYPFSDHSMTKFRWNYLQYTGNLFGVNHAYSRPDRRGVLDVEYIDDHNPDNANATKNYRFIWNHYQAWTPRLEMNAKINYVNTQSYGNYYTGGLNPYRVINPDTGLLSELGFNYKLPKANFGVLANRKDQFDPVTGKVYVGSYVFPQFTFSTIPLIWKKFPMYTSFTGGFSNYTLERTSIDDPLIERQSGNAGVNLTKDYRIKNTYTLTPKIGLSETWSSFNPADISSGAYFQARMNLGLDVRRRYFRTTDITLGEQYVTRLVPNGTKQDLSATDHGVEVNQLSFNSITRIGRSSRLSFNTGYDLRQAPTNNPDAYPIRAARVRPPSMDLDWKLRSRWSLGFREVYSVYNPQTQKASGSPLNTSGSLQYGSPTDLFYFAQGFSYSKPSSGQPSMVNLSNRLKFYLTKKWYLDFAVSYRAEADEHMRYTNFFPNERNLTVVRDMHCWLLRMVFFGSDERKEVSFYIDLKTNAKGAKNVFTKQTDPTAYATADWSDNLNQIFPDETEAPKPQQ